MSGGPRPAARGGTFHATTARVLQTQHPSPIYHDRISKTAVLRLLTMLAPVVRYRDTPYGTRYGDGIFHHTKTQAVNRQ